MRRFSKLALATLLAAAACYPAFTFTDNPQNGGQDGGLDGSTTDGQTLPSDGSALDAGADATAGMILLGEPGTAFRMRIEVSQEGDILEDASASFSHRFLLDSTEVKAGEFNKWLAAGRPMPDCGQQSRCTLDPKGPYETGIYWDRGWNSREPADAGCAGQESYGRTTREMAGEYGDYPITCVNWFEALAYCAWQGKRLPTETEWMYAATFGGRNLMFPFTADFDLTRMTCKQAIHNYTFPDFLTPQNGCLFPIKVASTDPGPNGIFDLSGSVSEWVYDWIDDYPLGAGVDYVVNDREGFRVRHGGAFIHEHKHGALTNPRRESFIPEAAFNDQGFRCAKSVLTQ